MRRTTPLAILAAMRPKHAHALAAAAAAALLVPAAAVASAGGDRGSASPVAVAATTDGTLTVRNAAGTLVLSGRGSVIGQLVGKGRLLIEDPDPTDGVPVVSGYDRLQRQGRTGVLYIGSDLRFRVLGGQFRVRVVASGISFSFVGRGVAMLAPSGSADDGSYSLDGGDTYRPLGTTPSSVVVGPTSSVQPPSGMNPAVQSPAAAAQDRQ